MEQLPRSTIIGVFAGREQADQAVAELHRTGFTDDEIGYVLRGGNVARPEDIHGGKEAEPADGAVTGAIAGASIGSVLAAAAAAFVPGIGPVLSGGILAGLLGGAAVGAATGGLLGALLGMGIPEAEARFYEGELQSGHALIMVKTVDRATEAHEILRRNGGWDLEHDAPQAAIPAATITAERNHNADLADAA
ncbi:MAG: hypothetical protein QOF51_4091 [Chloroflexota bacterium]|jgi:hypothetical protein|nr:hypothetical protein [Chloroflexota bacterium]